MQGGQGGPRSSLTCCCVLQGMWLVSSSSKQACLGTGDKVENKDRGPQEGARVDPTDTGSCL